MSERKISIGDPVVFVDAKFVEHAALVTHVWGAETYPDDGGRKPGLNIIYVSNDANREDQYGRQIIHETSVTHITMNEARAMVWKEVA